LVLKRARVQIAGLQPAVLAAVERCGVSSERTDEQIRKWARAQAVLDYGFTGTDSRGRQARFLVVVMQHSGLCVRGQYADAPRRGAD
jgi:hypothetical protein